MILSAGMGSILFLSKCVPAVGSINMAAESISYRKQNKLRQLASYYLLRNGLSFTLCRFDVVLILLDEERQSAREMRHIKNAF